MRQTIRFWNAVDYYYAVGCYAVKSESVERSAASDGEGGNLTVLPLAVQTC